MRRWTPEDRQFIIDNYETMSWQGLSKRFKVSKSAIKSQIWNMGVKKTSNAGRFKKGHTSWNKGIKGTHFSSGTEFKKGCLPHNTKNDGYISERMDKRSGITYKYIRISKGEWMLLHRFFWELVFGEIPKGHIIRFKNGDSLDCRIENLEMIDRATHVAFNTGERNSDNFIAAQLAYRDPELKKYIIEMHPELIELQRLKHKLKKEIKNVITEA